MTVQPPRPTAGPAIALCADARCKHARGWHRRDVGACLECGCVEFKKPSLFGLLRAVALFDKSFDAAFGKNRPRV